MASSPPPPAGPPSVAPPEETRAPDDAERVRASCPRCATPYEPGQEYCLECGVRLPIPGGLVTVLGRAWRDRLGWYPGDWIWPVLLGLLVAALGAAVAIYLSRKDEQQTPTLVATTPTPTATTTQPPEETTPRTDGRTTTAGTTTTVATTTAPPPQTLRSWPAGRTGYTVVLSSVPTTAGRAFAVSQAQRALRSGFREVGVLSSSEYASLHPGYWAVFSGIYDSSAEATRAANRARARGYRSAYPRRITP